MGVQKRGADEQSVAHGATTGPRREAIEASEYRSLMSASSRYCWNRVAAVAACGSVLPSPECAEFGVRARWSQSWAMANSSTGESVVARLSRILASFDDEHPSMSLTSLAARAALPISTTQRLVVGLLTHGFLEKDTKGCLRVGALIREAGLTAPGSTFLVLRNAAVPLMESAHAVLKQQITLAVLDKDEVLYLERVSMGSTSVNMTQKFARLPLLKTPSGLVLLAQQPLAFQEKVMEASLNPEDLRATLAGVRNEGFVTRPSILTNEGLAVSVPVTGNRGGLPAALTAVIPRAGAEVNLTVAVLRSAAFAISKALDGDQQLGLGSRRL